MYNTFFDFRRIIRCIKTVFVKDTVFGIATILAILSMFLVHPSLDYISYIDFRVLVLLFCLMMVVAGLSGMGVFELLMNRLMRIVHKTRQLVFVLVLICFLTSMWITNDVALITFVPFAIMVLNAINQRKLMIVTIVLQTIAANLGSMCMPIGNPQNLYLYSTANMDFMTFIKILLPVTIVSLILIVIACMFVKNETIVYDAENLSSRKTDVFQRTTVKLVIFFALFVLCLLTVLHVLDYRILLGIVCVLVLIAEPRLFIQADYILLLTFVAFFIFVGNMKHVYVVDQLLNSCVRGNEILVSVIASQIISNVPAAVLLSGFTDNYSGLLLGTDIGGLGTIIASMASLISYKFYCATEGANKGRYMLVFTVLNLLFLVILLLYVFLIV